MSDPTLALSGREGALIAALTDVVPTAPGEFGPGDDCARLSAGPRRVLTTDTLIEGTHFIRPHPACWLGWKALATNLSDVAAMGAVPEGFTLSIAVPPALPKAWWGRFAQGLAACAQGGGGDGPALLVGGDIVASPGPLVITVTCWGVLEGEESLRRDGGQVGDGLWVIGHLGRSAAGLRRWLAQQQSRGGSEPWPSTAPPDIWQEDPLLRAHLRPEPPLDAGPQALRAGVRVGMDLSDGLWLDAARLARASGVSAVLMPELLPRDPALEDVSPMARIAAGEDYGLLMGAPHSLDGELEALGAHRIGELVEARESPLWIKRSGQWVEIGAAIAEAEREAPFQHFT